MNELEAARLAGGSPSMTAEQLLDALSEKYPHSNFVLTMGSHGVICRLEKACCSHPAYQVQAVDTTGAGDTFCGYFMTGAVSAAGFGGLPEISQCSGSDCRFPRGCRAVHSDAGRG